MLRRRITNHHNGTLVLMICIKITKVNMGNTLGMLLPVQLQALMLYLYPCTFTICQLSHDFSEQHFVLFVFYCIPSQNRSHRNIKLTLLDSTYKFFYDFDTLPQFCH